MRVFGFTYAPMFSLSSLNTAAQHPIQAAMMDLDGTLVDTLGDFEAALNAMLAALGCPSVSRAEIEQMVGKGSEHLVRSALERVAPAKAHALFPSAIASYQSHYARINGAHSRVYEGVMEGLAALQAQGWVLACVTNKPTRFAAELLAQKGLEAFFSVVVGGDAYPQKKPHPMPLWRTCEALGYAPSQTLMIGDSSNDAEAARAAGCPVVLVSYGYNHGQPIRQVQAHGYLDSLAEMRRWFA
jgi:phosphoglycolate phosphatase